MDPNHIKEIRAQLLNWGQSNMKVYPWRESCDPWVGMLAEILLQRTHVRHVEKYFAEVVALFPRPEVVLTADPNTLATIQERFGLGRRVRTISEAARLFCDSPSPPRDIQELMQLYGVGRYTASAFVSLYSGIRAVILDRNIARCFGRLTGKPVPENLRHCKWLDDLAKTLTPQKKFKEYNLAILDFTIEICRSKNPQCSLCPLSSRCDFYEKTQLHEELVTVN